ncbi:CRPV-373 [Crowpox virus]|nr:CRPV-373 [Crowpox virus]
MSVINNKSYKRYKVIRRYYFIMLKFYRSLCNYNNSSTASINYNKLW